MPRKRMLSPDIWTDDALGTLPFEHRLLFIGLFSMSDDEGFVRAAPAYLRATLFPYDSLSVERMLQIRDELLAAMRSIELLENEQGIEYIQLLNWKEYQKIDRPKPSKVGLCIKKAAIPTASRLAIAARYGVIKKGDRAKVQCHYCGKEGTAVLTSNTFVHFTGLEIDHIIPESEGGGNGPDNLILTCRTCNRTKGNGILQIRRTIVDGAATMPDNCSPNRIEKKGIEKKGAYADNVALTEEEHGKLVAAYGAVSTKKLIEKLDNYKGSNGRRYKSDYRAILSWVVPALGLQPLAAKVAATWKCPDCGAIHTSSYKVCECGYGR